MFVEHRWPKSFSCNKPSATRPSASCSRCNGRRQYLPLLHPAAAPRPRTTMTGSLPTLRLGSHGAAVEELQTKLNLIPSAAGDVFLSVDGGFGGATETAVKAFQHTRMGLATP